MKKQNNTNNAENFEQLTIDQTAGPATEPATAPAPATAEAPKKRTRPVAKLPEQKAETDMKDAMNPPAAPAVCTTPADGITVYDAEFVKAFKKHETAIQQGYKAATNSFLKIAFNLHWIYSNEAYKTAGKENIYDYARDRFDISRGTAHGYITVAERFGRKALESDTLCIRDEYEGFSPSQLIIMAGYTDEQLAIAEITKEMSCRAMKTALKQIAAIDTTAAPDENAADVTAEDTADESAPLNSDIMDTPDKATKETEITNTLISFIGADEYHSKAEVIDDLILNLLTQKPNAKISVCYTA